jgi:predicted DNA-binding transcriptional regulator YafY
MPKKLGEQSKQVRQQNIYNMLKLRNSEEHALKISEIHEHLQSKGILTTQKTIRRDLEDMIISHKLVTTHSSPIKYYSSDYKPDFQLTFSEWDITTMLLALSGLKEMSDPFLKNLCMKTETILLSKFPKDSARDFENFKQLTTVTPAFQTESAFESADTYLAVIEALKSGRVIQCQNHSPWKPKAEHESLRVFSPLKLHIVGSEQYLMAMDHQNQQIKRLKICRLRQVKLLDQKVDPELVHQLEKHQNTIGAFGGPNNTILKYRIHCDEIMATLFRERRIHSSQSIAEEQGQFVITFETYDSDEIARCLAGWAPHISRVEPPKLADDLERIWQAGLNLKSKKVA